MPWCDDCSHFWNEENLGEGGSCPTCRRELAVKSRQVPWHFKLMLVAFVVYMIYRVYWFVEWLPKHW